MRRQLSHLAEGRRILLRPSSPWPDTAALLSTSTRLQSSSATKSSFSTPVGTARTSVEQQQDKFQAAEVRDRVVFGPSFYHENLEIDQRAMGIPFQISDARAIDALNSYHGHIADIVGVDRVLLPFWLTHVGAAGRFAGDVYMPDPASAVRHLCGWFAVPEFDFYYPFEDHLTWTQVSASHSTVPPKLAEETLVGSHIPSLLISRYELLQECEEMKNPPKVVPFQVSAQSSVGLVAQRVTRDKVMFHIRKQLKMYYSYKACRVRMKELSVEAVGARPVFLPAFAFTVRAFGQEFPTLVCGVTGKVGGPVLNLRQKRNISVGVGVGSVVGATASIFFFPPFAAAAGLTAGAAVAGSLSAVHYWQTLQRKAFYMLEASASRGGEESDQGFKWSAAAEEKWDYESREELRAKARQRAEFERRLREDAEREETFKRTGKAMPESKRRRGYMSDPDPLSYYKILGLEGKERSSQTIDIAKAYRAKALQYHPDTTKLDKKQAEDQMSKLAEAYQVLRDRKLRREYDAGSLVKTEPRADKETR